MVRREAGGRRRAERVVVTEAFVTPQLLRWARERDRLTAERTAKRIQTTADRLAAWEAGEARPTFDQARRLAEALHVPFGYLFLARPPQETLPLPDLRTVGGRPLDAPRPDLLDVLNDALAKQQWYRDYREEEGAVSLAFVGRYSVCDAPETIAADIRTTLGIDGAFRERAENRDEFLALLNSSMPSDVRCGRLSLPIDTEAPHVQLK